MTHQQLIGLLIILWGGYALAAGVFGWRHAQRGRRIRALVRLIGPVGFRIVSAIAGVAMIIGGILMIANSGG
ncbi:MAG: hypothetical protein Kow0077_13630 [Anaerolineae bacterium]